MANYYINFPISLLRGYLTRKTLMLSNIYAWCIMTDIERKFYKEYEAFSEIDESYIFDALKDYAEADTNFPCGWNYPKPTRQLAVNMLKVYKKHKDARACFVNMPKQVFISEYSRPDNPSTKAEEWDCLVFLGYAALRSIQGRNNLISKATNEMMWARMSGFSKWEDVQTRFIDEGGEGCKEEFAVLQKYFTIYYAHKLRDAIEQRFPQTVKVYDNHTRGFWFTTKQGVSRDELTEQVMMKKPAYKRKQLRDKKREAEERARKKLGL